MCCWAACLTPCGVVCYKHEWVRCVTRESFVCFPGLRYRKYSNFSKTHARFARPTPNPFSNRRHTALATLSNSTYCTPSVQYTMQHCIKRHCAATHFAHPVCNTACRYTYPCLTQGHTTHCIPSCTIPRVCGRALAQRRASPVVHIPAAAGGNEGRNMLTSNSSPGVGHLSYLAALSC